MKRTILTLAIAVMGFTAAFAQDTTRRHHMPMSKISKLTAEQRAEKATAAMDKKLSLTADQKTKVYAVELDRAKKMDAWRSANKDAMKGKMKDRKAEMDASKAQLDQILNADQKTKLDAFRAEAKEKMKNMKPRDGKGRKPKPPVVSDPPAQG
ncbi:hypothetical protein [Pedobacter nototheniae]|uniref:hypothetical protein n=1 Tax=Pedobacter nototheniae TaxID=2488994 RepID=UPI00103E90B2|nr:MULTISPECIES: hypothetical protein [Pedobacter]